MSLREQLEEKPLANKPVVQATLPPADYEPGFEDENEPIKFYDCYASLSQEQRDHYHEARNDGFVVDWTRCDYYGDITLRKMRRINVYRKTGKIDHFLMPF